MEINTLTSTLIKNITYVQLKFERAKTSKHLRTIQNQELHIQTRHLRLKLSKKSLSKIEQDLVLTEPKPKLFTVTTFRNNG